MPKDPVTGKTDRSRTKEELRRFRINQLKPKMSTANQPARGSRDVDEPEGSGSAPSPLATLAALGDLALDSGGSSVANTPTDSPTLARPPLPDRPTSALPKAPKTRHVSKRSAGESTSNPVR